jgi:hypothetical protein
MVPPYGIYIYIGGKKKKMLYIISKGFPSWYAINVPASRGVWKYVEIRIDPMFDLYSGLRQHHIKNTISEYKHTRILRLVKT